MRLTPQDLEKISTLTLEHYNRSVEDFHAGTHFFGDYPGDILQRLTVRQELDTILVPHQEAR